MAATSSGGMKDDGFKIVLLGEGRVGKTSLVLCYVKKMFNEKHNSTIQASYQQSQLVVNGKCVKINIWDTAGQEKFHALGPIYYRDSHGALLVYDITDEDSFEKVKKWVRELRMMLGNDVCIGIVGNKIDLEKDRKVNAAAAEEYAAQVGAKHYLTSAKYNRGIDELFYDISLRILENAEANTQQRTNKTKNVLVVKDEPPQTKSGCCSSG